MHRNKRQIKRVKEYGVALDKLLSGAVRPPAERGRFDIHVDGTAVGPKLKGAITGVDYTNLRADGRLDLNFHAEITTDDGKKIALFANGVVTPKQGSPVAQLCANVAPTTAVLNIPG